MIVTRTLTTTSININTLVEEIGVMAKYNFVRSYNNKTGELNLDVGDGWLAADNAELDLIISNHDPAPAPVDDLRRRVSHSFAGGDAVGVSTTSGTFKRVAEFIYPGTIYAGGVHDIIRVRLTKTGATDVAIRIRDFKNDKTVLNVTSIKILADGEYETIQLKPLANLSKDRSSWEILLKVGTAGGGNTAFLSAIEIS